ncbi:MAG: DUF4352 domain-containing protein [Chloroflexota bacterium]|nr:DUF4352 domain-containing protein [Chloroflexota bacterium]
MSSKLFAIAIGVVVLLSCAAVKEDPSSRAAGVSGTPAPTTARPTPTPEATIRKKVGAAVQYEDGWKITVTAFAEQPPKTGLFASTPAPGNRYVKLTVRYDNGTAKEASFNVFDWKLQDSAGVRKSQTFALVDLTDPLSSGKLAPGGFVSGSIVFELPAGEKNALAIYESFAYKQATWELY